ncbi:MAG: bifunctional diaminohydroxyphosphoribosylaminopyrimidine deaminase/5-amino-6-(5-phosphoribosylamino)uracil reductase RibD, partial [Flavobacteriaceae bacterium]
AVVDKSKLSKATLYVTLEPCSHYGKTPPCADLIIAQKIPKVVIGTKDPNIKVAGQGIEKLRQAGIEVIEGPWETECKNHHRRFLTFHSKKRPYIILKWAQTTDGYIAPSESERNTDPQPFWITGEASRQLAHKWRSQEQAILVGTKTVLKDNPKLNVRYWYGINPTRIILDRALKIPQEFHVLDGSVKTIVLTEISDTSKYHEAIDYELIDFSKKIAAEICHALYKHNITSVLIEGGTQILQTFIDENLWDEARVFTGPATFKNGLKGPSLNSKILGSQNIESDVINMYSYD